MDLPDKYKFKPSDFIAKLAPNVIADSANAKLAILFRDAVSVSTHDQRSWFIEEASEPRLNTHTALLICVEEIKPCEHEVVSNLYQQFSDISFGVFSSEGHCKKCGKLMKATWAVSE